MAIIGSILVIFQKQFDLNLDPTAVAAGIGAVLTYIFFEGKLDLKALASQPGKWKDWKFWITILSTTLAGIEANFQLGIPVEAIVSALTGLVAMLFGVQFKKTMPY